MTRTYLNNPLSLEGEGGGEGGEACHDAAFRPSPYPLPEGERDFEIGSIATKRFQFFNRGVSLVELIAAIVVIGVALAGVLMVFIRNTSSSADPMIAHQAIAIAEAYLEEALTKNFPVGPGATRATYDDVRDYNFTDNGARDQNGTSINGLGGYTVQVQAALDGLNNIVVASGSAIRVQVTVTPPAPSTGTVVIGAYRTNY